MISNKHISQAVNSIREWSNNQNKIVIGIDGYVGAWKTTLINKIGREMSDAIIVHRDDFNIPREKFGKFLKKLNMLFNKRIFININNTKNADERRRKREKEIWGAEYYPDTKPDSYIRLITIAYKKYLLRDKPKERSDLAIEVG